VPHLQKLGVISSV